MQRHVLETIDPRVLGRRLQEARKARGLTQQDVADSLTVARTTVTALEKGARRVQPQELVQLARLYGTAVSDLVGPKERTADFAVQFRTSVADVGSQLTRTELDLGVQEFQRLCEDYVYVET